MTALPTAVILHIVIELACFDTPAQVAATVKEKFGLTVSRQRIEAYHPERQAGAKLSIKWRTIFYDTRARLLAELDDIPSPAGHTACACWSEQLHKPRAWVTCCWPPASSNRPRARWGHIRCDPWRHIIEQAAPGGNLWLNSG